MNLLHVRHATSILYYAGVRILIDPVFSDKGASPAIPLTPNQRRNPLVNLKTPMDTLLNVDLVLSTHTHGDHFDDKAKECLDKKIPLICQPEDVDTLQSYGFCHLIPVEHTTTYKTISFTRVNAQHGCGAIGKKMGPASGYLLSEPEEPTVYITGDTIYNTQIKENIIMYQPEILLINAGSPKFLMSNQIVMNIMDIEETLKVNPALTFIIVHLDTYNHCMETREDVRTYFTPEKQSELGVKHFFVPEDNEHISFTR